MLFQRVNRTNPEKIFLVAKNSWSTASLTNGQAVIWDYTTDVDGLVNNWDALTLRLEKGNCKPASTLLGVTRLASPDYLIEIEATAVA